MNFDRKANYLKAMGIQTWQQKTIAGAKMHASATTEHSAIIGDWDAEWQALEQQVNVCTACELYQTRTHTVFGSGNRRAQLMIIGEAPGATEDQQGLPFVGRAGQLLTAMLAAIGIQREQVYITNILKSRPPQNRDPKPAEVAACTPFLLRQLELISPKLILALGRISAHYLLQTNTPLGRLRGQLFQYEYRQIPLLVTYHPAYLLRSPRDKRKAYQDLQLVAEFLAKSPP